MTFNPLTEEEQREQAVYAALRIAEKHLLGMDEYTKAETMQAVFAGLNAMRVHGYVYPGQGSLLEDALDYQNRKSKTFTN